MLGLLSRSRRAQTREIVRRAKIIIRENRRVFNFAFIRVPTHLIVLFHRMNLSAELSLPDVSMLR